MHPLGYFASAPSGTPDSLILRDIEDQIGSYSENLSSEDKLAFLAVLTRYLYFRQSVVPGYSIGQASADTQRLKDTAPNQEAAKPDTTPETGDIWDILLTLEGISTENALGLLQFIAVTEQQSYFAEKPAALNCHCRAQRASVIDPGSAWAKLLPLDCFTIPKFSFGQRVQSQDREICGRIVGMEFALDGSEQARYLSPGWHYLIANEVRASSSHQRWRVYVDSVPEADLIMISGGKN